MALDRPRRAHRRGGTSGTTSWVRGQAANHSSSGPAAAGVMIFIAVMTLINRGYFQEIVGSLRGDGFDVHHATTIRHIRFD
jgi:hypothetical protein